MSLQLCCPAVYSPFPPPPPTPLPCTRATRAPLLVCSLQGLMPSCPSPRLSSLLFLPLTSLQQHGSKEAALDLVVGAEWVGVETLLLLPVQAMKRKPEALDATKAPFKQLPSTAIQFIRCSHFHYYQCSCPKTDQKRPRQLWQLCPV